MGSALAALASRIRILTGSRGSRRTKEQGRAAGSAHYLAGKLCEEFQAGWSRPVNIRGLPGRALSVRIRPRTDGRSEDQDRLNVAGHKLPSRLLIKRIRILEIAGEPVAHISTKIAQDAFDERPCNQMWRCFLASGACAGCKETQDLTHPGHAVKSSAASTGL